MLAFMTQMIETEDREAYVQTLYVLQKAGIACTTRRAEISSSRTIYRLYVKGSDYRRACKLIG